MIDHRSAIDVLEVPTREDEPARFERDVEGNNGSGVSTRSDFTTAASHPLWFNDHPVSVVIPAMNEADSLPYVLRRIPEWVYEVVLVDGYSTDDTVEIARRMWPGIRVITQEGRGKGAALRCGIAAARGDIIVMLDADGSTDPAHIPAFAGALLGGADFAKASRFLQGSGSGDMTPIRWVGNWGFAWFTNLLFGTKYTDVLFGYNAVWRRHKDALALEIDDWSNEIVSNIRVARRGLKVVEVASFEHERVAGEAKLQTWSAGWMILKAILSERWKPLARLSDSRNALGALRQAVGRV